MSLRNIFPCFGKSDNEIVSTVNGKIGFGQNTMVEGEILYVTSLEDDGSVGTLRWALELDKPRIVKFNIQSAIEPLYIYLRQKLVISNPYCHLSGLDQRVIIRGAGLRIEGTHDVIISHMTIRIGDESSLGKGYYEMHPVNDKISGDVISAEDSYNVYIHHCSLGWGFGENVAFKNCVGLTISHCIISEPLSNPSLHLEDGEPMSHPFACSLRGNEITFYQNIIAHSRLRNPNIDTTRPGSAVKVEIINNVIYHWTSKGTKINSPEDMGAEPGKLIVYGNYYRQRSGSESNCIVVEKQKIPTKLYIKKNSWPGGVSGLYFDRSEDRLLLLPKPPFFQTPLVKEKLAIVMANAGNIIPYRDHHDERIMRDILKMTGDIIFSPDDVGGF